MLAIFSGGPRDGQEIEVDPLPIIRFPASSARAEWIDRTSPIAVPTMSVHAYCKASASRLDAIRSLPYTPTYIKVQLSKAEVLYEYEGESRG